MAFIRQQASFSNQMDNQHLLGNATLQIDSKPLQIEE
jgi:6,7-dimethyl-8-ribityllumazine synthase